MMVHSFLGISKALILGAVMGPIYKVLASSQYLCQSNSELIWLWKKYPKRSYQRFTAILWVKGLSSRNPCQTDAVRMVIQHRFPSEPFPLLKIVANSLLIILIIPISGAMGLIQGPLFLLREHFEHK